MRRLLSLFLSLLLIFTMAACSNTDNANSDSVDNNTSTDIISPSQSTNDLTQNAQSSLAVNEMFTARDKEIGYDEGSATKITLSNQNVAIDKEGLYILSGTLADGQIVVEASDTEKVQLVLDNATITSSNCAPIYVKSADKVFITLASGSTNTLSTTGEFATGDENNVDGVIFSKSDISLNGNGSLIINTDFGHGIVGKDDVVFTGGNYTITSSKKGISANDSVRIADGTIAIASATDGIQVENTEEPEKGFFYMANGTLTVKAEGDAISASGIMQIDGGTYTLTTGEGAESVTLESDRMGMGSMRPNMQEQQSTTEEETISQKGLKSDSGILINQGEFTIDTVDDNIHSGGNSTILNGNFTMKSGDDSIHSDEAVIIEDGNFNIPYCYEGIEGLSITINGGTFDIISSDDGFNAAGGADSSGFGGRGDPFATTEGAFITINDGNIMIVSDGDSLDSNGALTINGGTLNLTCNGNGNGNTAIDASGTYENNGGNITTNDGSESGTHMGARPNGMEPPSNPERKQQSDVITSATPKQP